jgi:Domain of unknown function (DUF4120)
MPLIIECQEHYNEVLDFALKHDATEQLRTKLTRLETMCAEPDTVCYLHKDFAPLSFVFLLQEKGRRSLVGGVIYSGPGQPLNGSGPAFSVSIDPPTELHSWSIHT